MERSKIVFIVQRYGLEVNGGAEQHCRLLAERLTAYYDVDVFTSCALTYQTWDNYYPEGQRIINGVRVTRFPTVISRSEPKGNPRFRFLRRRKTWQRILKKTPILNWLEEVIPSLKPSEQDFKKWVYEQGPSIPDLISYLQENHDKYKALIFFTYLYYPTIHGLEIAPSKSILIPTAHDENPIYIPFFKRIFNLPGQIIYNTAFEKLFVNNLFNNNDIDSEIAGVGIDFTAGHSYIDIRKTYNISKNYLVYIGRVDASKGCKTLIEYFNRYNAAKGNRFQLVLVGQLFMDIPIHPDIISLGFVSEEVKWNVLKQAEALVMPSLYESLSMVTLEAMQLERPVIVNGNCEVLKQHIELSQAGFIYKSYNEFAASVDKLLSDKKHAEEMGRAGKKYVETYYSWDRITKIFLERIEKIPD